MKTQTIYVVKYALTKGIFCIEAELLEEGKYAREVGGNVGGGALPLFLSRNDYALDREEAIQKAEERRIRRLKSLARDHKKVSVIDFEAQVAKA